MNLLLAIDGSPHSEPPIVSALTRPWPAATRVRVLSVVETQKTPGLGATSLMAPDAYADAQRTMHREAEALVQSVATRLRAAGLSVETLVRDGDIGDEIVEQARSWPADLVLLGSRGRSGIKRVLLGSVAHHVVAHAPSSVEVARVPSSGT